MIAKLILEYGLFNHLFFRTVFLSLLIALLLSCDTHPTTKSNYTNQNYDGFTIVEVEWDDVPLKQVIQTHHQLASNKNQKIFIQITAEWCSPCKRLRTKTEDPLMKSAYQGVYIIRLDRDEWEKDFAELSIKKTPIPIFWELNDDPNNLKVTNYTLGGNYWKEITAKALSPLLKAYFSGQARPFIENKQSKASDL
ncbi:MAG: thiol:disulfide interchange protein [Polaribacter sp.]